jgi:hypothetical protein
VRTLVVTSPATTAAPFRNVSTGVVQRAPVYGPKSPAYAPPNSTCTTVVVGDPSFRGPPRFAVIATNWQVTPARIARIPPARFRSVSRLA